MVRAAPINGGAAPAVLFLAWGAVGGRSTEIAGALGGQAVCLFPPGASPRPGVLMRYARSSVETVRILRSMRPAALIVTNPPVIPGLIGLGWSRITGRRIALDSHPGAFGAMEDQASARLLPVHRWLARRVDVSLVAAPVWQEEVEAWGGRAMVLHEAPAWDPPAPAVLHDPFRILYVGTFAGDEPAREVCDAARLLPDCRLLVTGDPAEAPDGLIGSAPENVRFVGFLDTPAYREEIARADLVVTLTTEPGSVMRAAYEAVYAGRPLVISDWPILRELFPTAIHVRNDAEGLAHGIRQARARHPELVARTGVARDLQLARFQAQRDELARFLDLD